MAEPNSILMLRRKAEEIKSTIALYEKRLKEARKDLAHVNTTLHIFQAYGEPEDLPRYANLNMVFKRGETTALCMEALRKFGEQDTRELTTYVMKAKGLNADDKVLREAIALRIVQTMRMHARRGTIDGSRWRKNVCLWGIKKHSEF